MTQPQSDLVTNRINEFPPWQRELLTQARSLIKQTLPDVVEDIKWRRPANPKGVPVWSLDGIICTGESYKAKVKISFPKGALLDDPDEAFNGSLGGKSMRAVDLLEGDVIKDSTFTNLVKAAAALNAEDRQSKKG